MLKANFLPRWLGSTPARGPEPRPASHSVLYPATLRQAREADRCLSRPDGKVRTQRKPVSRSASWPPHPRLRGPRASRVACGGLQKALGKGAVPTWLPATATCLAHRTGGPGWTRAWPALLCGENGPEKQTSLARPGGGHEWFRERSGGLTRLRQKTKISGERTCM